MEIPFASTNVLLGFLNSESVETLSDQQKISLLLFLSEEFNSKNVQFTDSQKKLILSLKIFQTFDKTISNGMKKSIAPPNIENSLLEGFSNLLVCSEKETLFLQHLGVQKLNLKVFYTDVVFPKIRTGNITDNIKKLMISMITNDLPNLLFTHNDFKALMSELKFIPLKNGKFGSISEVYDPRVEDLLSFFKNENVFPSEEFSTISGMIFNLQFILKSCITWN
jgi:hypothetical protein